MSSPQKKKGGKGKKPVVIEGAAVEVAAAKPVPQRDILVVTDDLDEHPIAGIEAEADAFQHVADALPNIVAFEPQKIAKKGRPTLYSDELVEDLLSELASGKTVMEVCALEDMPVERTFYRWQIKYPEFAKRVVQAQRISINSLYDHARDIAHGRVKEGRLESDLASQSQAIEVELKVADKKAFVCGMHEIIAPTDGAMPGDGARTVQGVELPAFDPQPFAKAVQEFTEKTGVDVAIPAPKPATI